MNDSEWLAAQFEESRPRLRGVAYRMLGTLHEADDAVQEAWLRLSRTERVDNLGGWLTSVVARVCLDMLRSRKSRREEPFDAASLAPARSGPEQEALLADSVGLAVLVVLNKLSPAERLAFVLHDMFAVPFEEIAALAGRTPAAARQLASRARRRVQGTPDGPTETLETQREVAASLLKALKDGDMAGLVAVLDPDLVVRVDVPGAGGGSGAAEVRGAQEWARQAVAYARAARFSELALVNGTVGEWWLRRAGSSVS